jgi:hypothetical protein
MSTLSSHLERAWRNILRTRLLRYRLVESLKSYIVFFFAVMLRHSGHKSLHTSPCEFREEHVRDRLRFNEESSDCSASFVPLLILPVRLLS